MSRVRHSAQASADIDEISDYFALHNPDFGLRLLDGIEVRCRTLARFPLVGRRRDELGPGVRSAVVLGYRVFFRPEPDGILVLRVLHGARDVGPESFGDPQP